MCSPSVWLRVAGVGAANAFVYDTRREKRRETFQRFGFGHLPSAVKLSAGWRARAMVPQRVAEKAPQVLRRLDCLESAQSSSSSGVTNYLKDTFVPSGLLVWQKILAWITCSAETSREFNHAYSVPASHDVEQERIPPESHCRPVQETPRSTHRKQEENPPNLPWSIGPETWRR